MSPLVRILLLLIAASSLWAQPPADPRLESYVSEALERNPRIHASFARYRAAQQRAPQVAGLPDPSVSLTNYVRSPETRTGPQTLMLQIQQRLPWWGKLSDQEQAAAKRAAAMRALHEAAKDEVRRKVKTAYYELGYVDRVASILREEIQLLARFEALARARYGQGLGPQATVIKLQAEVTRAQTRLEELRRQRIDAEAALNAARFAPPGTPVEPIELAAPAPIRAAAETLYETARRERPELHAALLDIEAEEKGLHIARRKHLPDLTIGASMINVEGREDPAGLIAPPLDNGKNAYSFTVGVNIPVFRRKYDAAVLEASERVIASRQDYRGMAREVEATVRSLVFRLESTERQIALFESTLIPQAAAALQSAETSYAQTAVNALDLLDSERMQFEVRLGLARLQADHWKARVELERAIGQTLEIQR